MDTFIQSNLHYIYHSNNSLGAPRVKCLTQRHNGHTSWIWSSRAQTSNLFAFSHHEIIYYGSDTFNIYVLLMEFQYNSFSLFTSVTCWSDSLKWVVHPKLWIEDSYLWIIVMDRIHWWACDAMIHFSKSVPMKIQNLLHFRWLEGEYIFSKCSFLGELLI